MISRASGLIYVDPLPPSDIGKFYKEDYRKEYKKTAVPKKKHVYRAGRVALSRLDRIRHILMHDQRVLDAASGGGEFLFLLKCLGLETAGIEPNQGYADYSSREYGLDIFKGLFSECSYGEGNFDVVTLFHALEHLENPVEDLLRLSSFLKEEGRFVIEVPNILFQGMSFRGKWHKGHLYGFDLITLEAVALKAGLEKVMLIEHGDGGNLFGIFRKTGEKGNSGGTCDLSGNFERAYRMILSNRRRYYLSPNPYRKPFGKIAKWFGERAATGPFSTGREILEELYRGVRDDPPSVTESPRG